MSFESQARTNLEFDSLLAQLDRSTGKLYTNGVLRMIFDCMRIQIQLAEYDATVRTGIVRKMMEKTGFTRPSFT